MKRLVLSLGICSLVAALTAPSSFGFASNFDYTGHARGNPVSSVGFFLKHSPGGRKKVAGFTVTQIPYTCSDAPPGATAGWRFKPKMRLTHRKFAGKGDWTGLPLDPVGKVSGKLRPGGVAVGDLKLKGELAGAGTHCHTGLLAWRATKNPNPL